MIRVLLADPICTNRLGIRSLLEKYNHCHVVDEVSSEESLIMTLTLHDYDLVVLEPTMAENAGELLIKRVRIVAPRCNILVLTQMSEAAFGTKALRCGVKGYLEKSCTAEDIDAAVTRVGQGRIYISHTLAELVARTSRRHSGGPLHESLSEREFQVFALLVCGKRVIDIGSVLSISTKTVSTHKLRIFQKLQVQAGTEAVKYAISHDLLVDCRTICDSAFGRSAAAAERIVDTRAKSVLPEPAVGKHSGTSVR